MGLEYGISARLTLIFYNRYIENSKSARDTLLFRWKARTLADAKAFIRLQTNVKTVEMNKGDIVYKEGDIGRSMYFVDEERGGKRSLYNITVFNQLHKRCDLMELPLFIS